ncbi:site-specific integrase [Geothrix sp. SG200]|uniref:tyrosine-type recombinase/integrase n=1 Tax=Geothrix sp. SG200 TaxID=2922865 RepID=UPI001FAC967C|nr:site-specific integrase [Geothrix sp. SG200]
MGRGRDLLSAVEVANSKLKPSQKRRYLVDGGGLYLMITRRAQGSADKKARTPANQVSKSWCFRYRSRVTKKPVELGLGPLADVPMARARVKAAELRGMLAEGIDPKTEIEKKRAGLKAEAAKVMTFDQATKGCIQDRKGGWKNEKHLAQWENTLETYASPVIGPLDVAIIDLALVKKVLDPIWTTKPETASRVRQRIEAVLAWATVHGRRKGPNPAQWKNNLDQILPPTSKVKKKKNHPALPYQQIGAFTAELRTQHGAGAKALEFLILTASRTNETLGADPKEFNLDRAIWTIPAERMKAEKEHTVPLCPRAVEIVRGLISERHNRIFCNSDGEALSDAVMLRVIWRMNQKRAAEGKDAWQDSKGQKAVPHGFRSTFRDWAGECSNFPREVIENALAHQLKDKAEAAYSRGTQLAKRKLLMNSWAAYCAKPSEPQSENVIPIRAEVG